MNLIKITIIVLLFSIPCHADLVTIEADDFPLTTSISDTFKFITLRGGPWEGFEGEIVAVDSTHSMNLLGDNVLGYSWDIEWWSNNRKLRVIFDGLAKSLSIKILGKEGSQRSATTIKGFNESNELVTEVNRMAHSGVATLLSPGRGPYEIAYYEIYSYYPVAYDDIVIDYQPVPEPATVILLALGALTMINFSKNFQ